MKINRTNPTTLCVYIIIALELLITGLNNSMYYVTHLESLVIMGTVSVALRLLLVGLAIIKYSKKIIKKRELVFLAVYAVFVVSNYLASRGWVLFDSFFIAIVFGDQLDYKKTLKLFFYTMLVTTIITIICYYAGFFLDYTFVRPDGSVRANLGFNHPNTLGKTAMCLAMLYILLHEQPLDIKRIILLLAVSVWIYVVPNSLTSALVVLATMITKIVIDRRQGKKKRKKKVSKLIIYGIPFFVIAAIYLMIRTGVGLSLVHSFSDTFYSRFVYGSKALSNYGITLFGQSIAFANELTINYFKTDTTYFTIDCFYIYMPVVVGVIPSLFFLYYYIVCMGKARNDQNSTMLAILFAMLLYCILESALTLFMFNFIFIGTVAYKRRGGMISEYNCNNAN